MTFSIDKRYNRKTRRVRNNQQLKYPTLEKNRELLNLVFIFSQLCKNGHSLFFSLEASNTFRNIITPCQRLRSIRISGGILTGHSIRYHSGL